MSQYTLRDGDSGVTEIIEANSDIEARAAAKDWARAGDYDLSYGPVYVDVYLSCETYDGYVRGKGSDDEERIVTVINQPEPECLDVDGHNWHEDSVRGQGGGVIVRESCTRCSLVQVTNTWAQRRDTGELVGTEVRYDKEYE